MQSRSAIDKGNSNKCNSSLGSGLKLKATQQTHNANFDALDNVNTSKHQSHNTQCSVMHSGLWSKKTCPSDMILPVISLYSLRSNNSMMQTLQLK